MVVIKNKQIEYIEQNRTKSKDQVRLGSVIVLTEKFEFDFDRLPNIIEHNWKIKFDYVQLPNVRLSTRSGEGRGLGGGGGGGERFSRPHPPPPQ